MRLTHPPVPCVSDIVGCRTLIGSGREGTSHFFPARALLLAWTVEFDVLFSPDSPQVSVSLEEAK